MNETEVYERIIADLRQLKGRKKIPYFTGKNFLANPIIDVAENKIRVTRGEKNISIGFDRLEKAANALCKKKPVSMEVVFTAGGNERTVIETLLAQCANIGILPANKAPNQGVKKLIWFDDEVHPVGELFDACDYLLEHGGASGVISSFEIEKITQEFCTAAKENAGLTLSQPLAMRTCAALLAKRFLILSGLSGSGKTKIAQALARWLTPDTLRDDAAAQDSEQATNPYCALVPVGADWVGSENILGYPNGLDATAYMTRQALDLILHAQEHPDVPHFLILDEMNLSHVERYFADILSAIESGDEISLYEGAPRQTGGRTIPNRVALPGNLFIIGTVNVDETTYMFSPKVLDRANVIEFRMAQHEIESFLAAPAAPDLDALQGEGAHFGEAFVAAARDKTSDLPETVKSLFAAEMLLLFGLLRDHHLEFGYRTAYETARFVRFFHLLGAYAADDATWFDAAMDAVVIQKILPKLHGSRAKLEGLLWALAWFCCVQRDAGQDFAAQLVQAGKAEDDAQFGPDALWETLAQNNAADPAAAAIYPMSFAKVMRMWRRLVRDQFVTFTEA